MKPSEGPKGLSGIGNKVVRAVVVALNARDRKGWFELFSEPAFSDDGITRDFVKWCDEELFARATGRIISVDRVQDGGLTFYATYHSSKWGDLQTFWKFVVTEGKVTKLDVGATSY